MQIINDFYLIKVVLTHEFGAGAKCHNCDCPGLDLHFWR